MVSDKTRYLDSVLVDFEDKPFDFVKLVSVTYGVDYYNLVDYTLDNYNRYLPLVGSYDAKGIALRGTAYYCDRVIE